MTMFDEGIVDRVKNTSTSSYFLFQGRGKSWKTPQKSWKTT